MDVLSATSAPVSSPWKTFTWYDTVSNVFGTIPEWIWGSIIGVESQGKTDAQGDYKNGTAQSFGLFQIYTSGGLGDAYKGEPAKLYDAKLNAELAAAAMKPHYEAGVKKGLVGFSLLEYVASHSGFPLQTGNMPAEYRGKLAGQYLGNYRATETGSYHPPDSGGSTPAPAPGNVSTDAPLLDMLRAVAVIENSDSLGSVGALNPLNIAKHMGVMILLVLLGLGITLIGLVAFVGLGKTSNMVQTVAKAAAL